MSKTTRKRCAAALALVVFGIFACTVWADEAGVDVWRIDDYRSQLEIEEGRQKDFERASEVILARLDLRLALTRELVAGEKTFAEVAEGFRQLDAEDPERQRMIEKAYPGMSATERRAAMVYKFARVELSQSEEVVPEGARERIRRAHEEYVASASQG